MPGNVMGGGWRARIGRSVLYAFTFALALLWAVPMAWAVVASLRPATDPLGRGDVWFAFPLTLENYTRALSLAPFGQYYINTIVVILMILAVQMVTITLAAFAFAHFDFPGKRVLFYLVLLQLMIPTT
ncbi:MAG TPA: ABC transporter permease, partial [Chloroflexi bacterium]|nr:ABC transporter permease [Chloroflexota bacterium]